MEKHTELRRSKLIALGFFVGAAVLFVASLLLPYTWWTGLLRAFAEAAMVGALADWFAVVALFRHPLGLPIPHTAIIPHGKARIADSLAVFVRDHFLEPAALLAKLSAFDPAKRLGQWLAEPAQAGKLADLARGWALQALDLLDEAAVRRRIHGFVVARLREWNAAATAGEILGLLTADGRHQALLDEALTRLGRHLDDATVKQRVSAMIVKYARREWPKLVGTVEWVKPVEGIADTLAERLAHALLDELQDVLSQPQHPLRQDYERWLGGYVQRLRSDPATADKLQAMKQRLIEHPGVQDYVQGLWDQIHASLREDLSRSDGVLVQHLQRSLGALGESLSQDSALRDALNQHLLGGAEKLTQRLRSGVTDHIAQTVKGWDERHLVEQLELSVGRDLQYIRFNGTLVGGLIGLALHAAVTLIP